MARFLHTSDWHLGRRLGEHDRLADQAHALEQVLQLARDGGASAILVSGDVFDRAVPPPEAVELLSGFLARAGMPVVIISGNHDSAPRLGFAAPLIATAGIHLRTRLDERDQPVIVGDTAIFCLPFLEPAEVAQSGHDAAVRAALQPVLRARQGHAGPAVLMAHLFVASGVESTESERPLAVGGSGQVEAEALAGFDYVALGHLHAPQDISWGSAHVRYSGSLLKYSFAEVEHAKGVSLVEVVAGKRPVVEHVPLLPRHDLVKLEASFDELLASPRYAFAERAYVEATYTDAGYVIDAAARLRERFPLLCAARPRRLLEQLGAEAPAAAALAASDDLALFRAFWSFIGEGVPTAEHESAFLAALREAPQLTVVP